MLLLIISATSQFPFWDFGECNEYSEEFTFDIEDGNSQFPFWDFGECNAQTRKRLYVFVEDADSQFPFWDFGECNMKLQGFRDVVRMLDSQFPFWDFGECNWLLNSSRPFGVSTTSLNSLSGISVNATIR